MRAQRLAASNVICRRFKNSRCFDLDCRFFHFPTVDGQNLDSDDYLRFTLKPGFAPNASEKREIRCIAHRLTPPYVILEFAAEYWVSRLTPAPLSCDEHDLPTLCAGNTEDRYAGSWALLQRLQAVLRSRVE